MKKYKDFIESGILEQYVLGTTTPDEAKEVERLAALDSDVRSEIEEISIALEQYARLHARKPCETVKVFLMATTDYTQRLENGESITFPPALDENSTINDFLPWLSRPDMIAPEDDFNLFAKIIGYTPECTTAIIWIKEYAPKEMHDDELERFLIVEGSCEIIVGDEVKQFKASDYFAVPLHAEHQVRVTSSIPCKIILQRIAA